MQHMGSMALCESKRPLLCLAWAPWQHLRPPHAACRPAWIGPAAQTHHSHSHNVPRVYLINDTTEPQRPWLRSRHLCHHPSAARAAPKTNHAPGKNSSHTNHAPPLPGFQCTMPLARQPRELQRIRALICPQEAHADSNAPTTKRSAPSLPTPLQRLIRMQSVVVGRARALVRTLPPGPLAWRPLPQLRGTGPRDTRRSTAPAWHVCARHCQTWAARVAPSHSSGLVCVMRLMSHAGELTCGNVRKRSWW